MPRFDMPVRRSGFWGIVPVRADGASGPVVLSAEVSADESRERTEIGRIDVAAADERSRPGGRSRLGAAGPGGLIAICMATFEPRRGLLEAQVDSLRRQTDTNWVCVISDDHSAPKSYETIEAIIDGDERFMLSRAPRRIGFYRNFERALRLAPGEAELIALCDQDDVWHSDKLAALRAALGPAALVYCDQRLVDADGRVLRDTLWSGRANNCTNLASMLIANTVTGAAALFRREVAELALPFPDSPGIEFHDHWIALTALASGEVRYVDRPLYDYVQHGSAVLGKVSSDDGPTRSRVWPQRPRMHEWRAAYFMGYVPGQVRAKTLLLRLEGRLPAAKRRALNRYLACETSPLAFLWLVLRPLRALAGRSETLGTEWEIARGVLWRWLAGAVAHIPRLPERYLLDCRFPDPPHYEQRRLQRWRSRI